VCVYVYMARGRIIPEEAMWPDEPRAIPEGDSSRHLSFFVRERVGGARLPCQAVGRPDLAQGISVCISISMSSPIYPYIHPSIYLSIYLFKLLRP